MPELLKGKCQRHKVRQCHRRHTQEYANKDDADMITVDTASIDCASLEGGTNYDSQWREWVCKAGASCPYNHVAPA